MNREFITCLYNKKLKILSILQSIQSVPLEEDPLTGMIVITDKQDSEISCDGIK